MGKLSRNPENPTNSCKKSRRSDLSVHFKIRTVKVNNIPQEAYWRCPWSNDIQKFFSFPGEIDFIDFQNATENIPIIAYVTFKDPISAAISVLLSGATIADQPVTIDLAPDYKLPEFIASAKPIVKMSSKAKAKAKAKAQAKAMAKAESKAQVWARHLACERDRNIISVGADPSAVRSARNAEDLVTIMLAAGFILGEDAINKAKSASSAVEQTIRTVEVKNISTKATCPWESDIAKFFSFLGEIAFIDTQSTVENIPLIAYVIFKDPIAASISVLLSGATIVDQPATIDLALDYKLPDFVGPPKPIVKMSTQSRKMARARKMARDKATERDQNVISVGGDPSTIRSARNAEDIVTIMLAVGFILGKDAISKAKAFDEKYQLTSAATATASK